MFTTTFSLPVWIEHSGRSEITFPVCSLRVDVSGISLASFGNGKEMDVCSARRLPLFYRPSLNSSLNQVMCEQLQELIVDV